MEQISLDRFTYKLTDDNRIVVEHPFQLPTMLYKFYSPTENSFNAFIKHYLYASAPVEFNDILDSSWLMFDFRNITHNEYQKFYTEHRTDFTPVGYEQDKSNEFATLSLHWYLCFSSQVGLVSMTSSVDNPLMWAHYTQETGYVIKYNSERLKHSLLNNNKDILDCHLLPIQYVSKLQPIDFFSRHYKTPTVPMTCITNLKLKNWNYEKEWRVSIRKENMGYTTGRALQNTIIKGDTERRKIYYTPNCIEAIYLSAYFFGNTYFEPSPSGILTVKPKYVPFINYLVEYHNHHLFSCGGERTQQNEVKRYYQQIQLLRKDINQFEIKIFPEIFFF